MIDLTVKTLDSQNHVFSVADDITIRQFKEHIAETVNVPADSQRLIYCGRVLQDENHLSEYDVNGKVIHLVQRAPPQAGQRGNSGGQTQGENNGRSDQAPGHGVQFQRAQFHTNPMYLGSISIPAAMVDATDRQRLRMGRRRLFDANRMLGNAERVFDRLENAMSAMTDETAAADVEPPENEEPANDDSAQNSEAFSHEFMTNVAMQVMREFASRRGTSDTQGAASQSTDSAPIDPPARSENVEIVTDEERTRPSFAHTVRNTRGASRGGRTRGSRQSVRPIRGTMQMADVLERLMEVQDRFHPFLMRYHDFMLRDPEIRGRRTPAGENVGTVEENQRFLDAISECFHCLSHVNHAISEIIIDAGQRPPRTLHRLPANTGRMETLRAGMPIQVQAHISLARNDVSNGEDGEETGETESRPPTSSAPASSATQNPVDLSFVVEESQQPEATAPTSEQQRQQQETTAPTSEQQRQQQETTAPTSEQQRQQQEATPPTSEQQRQQQQQQQQASSQAQFDLPFGAIFNLTNNIEVGLMEMGPSESGGITISGVSSATGTEQNPTNAGGNNNNNDNAPGTSRVTGIFPWGTAPPPEVIRNLMNVVAGYMAQSAASVAVATTTTSTTTPTMQQTTMSGGVGGRAAPNPGQSTQARSNVGTHPTTSTQTRSTARPHVFLPTTHQLGMGIGYEDFCFDRLLPCNFHHIAAMRTMRYNNAAAPSSQQTARNAAPDGSTQTQTAEAAPAENAADAAADVGTSSVHLRDLIANFRRSNGRESQSSATLEEFLIAQGINVTCPEGSSGGSLLQRIFTAFARIELSEWLAMINNGNFSRADTWHRLRSRLRSSMVLNEVELRDKDFLDAIESQLERIFSPTWTLDASGLHRAAATRFRAVITEFARSLADDVKCSAEILDDEEWGTNLSCRMRRHMEQLYVELRARIEEYGGQREFVNFIREVATLAMNNHHEELREWVVDNVVDWIRRHTPTLEYECKARKEDSRMQETSSQSAPEPMETEEVRSDPLELEDGQVAPTTFPGHEQLLPEWVPIIARDDIRQRRQLQLQSTGVTAFSDAYLDGLPSKRRKLVEQQKPRLLVSPTPNHSAITASMERLVRDSAVRAGVQEADGAAAAVAADPGVRRAFGQAIRECFNPRRFQSPDFPNARRFPNATSYFADKERPPKQ